MPRILRIGVTGRDVSEIQAALNFHLRRPAFNPLKPDGIFGPDTDKRVRAFQKMVGITVDGDVGADTTRELYRKVILPVLVVGARRQQTIGSNQFGFRRPSFFGSAGFGNPGFGQLTPPGSDKPNSAPVIQSQSAESDGIDVETKVTFNPLAGSDDDRFKLSITKTIPWPVIVPNPLTLELDVTILPQNRFDLDAKLQLPIEIIKTPRFEFEPYFFVGAGMKQEGFKELSVGAALNPKFIVSKDLFRSGFSLEAEAVGGPMYVHDLDENSGKFKFFFESSLILTRSF
jgi:peptidoglycan hydrolase-like protein with peptidoglycan-binding domain